MCIRDASHRRAALAVMAAVLCAALCGRGATAQAVAVEAVRDLQHGQYAVRARAVRLLGYLGGPEHVPALAQVLLHDRAREPRNAAATALAQIGAPAAGPVVRARLLTELMAGPAHALSEAVAGRRQAAILPLIRALGALRPDGAAQTVAACLDSADPVIRRAGLDALALLDDPAAVTALAAAVADGPADERLAAAASLGWNPHPGAVPALANLLLHGRDSPEVGEALVFALARQGGPAAAEALAHALEHPLARVRARAAEARGRLRPPEAASPVRLAWRGDDRAAATLVEALAVGPDASPDEGVLPPWRLAAETMALNGARHLAPDVARLLATPDRRLQLRALETLGMMGGEHALGILCAPELEGLPREARLARVGALATQHSERARDALRLALSDPDRAVAQLAAEALIFRGPPELPGLLELAEHSAPEGPVPGAVNEALRRALHVHGFADPAWDGPPREALARWARGRGAECEPGAFRPHAQVLRAQVGEAAALEELRALLLGGATPPDLREAACRAVGAGRLTAAAPLLRYVMEGLYGFAGAPPAWARGVAGSRLAATAAHALAALGDADVAGLLAWGLGEAPGVRAATITALARLDPAAAADLLPRALRDEAEAVRQAALDLAPSFWSVHSPALLAEMLPIATPAQRAQIAQMLWDMTGPAEVRLARRLAGDPEPAVALAALCALATNAPAVVTHAIRVTCPDPPQDAACRRALSSALGLLSSLHEGEGELREALGGAQQAYLAWPTSEGLDRVAQLWDRLGDSSTAQVLATRAAWERR